MRAISRIATPGEHALVERLVMVSEHGTVAQLEAIVRGLQTVDDNEQRAAGWQEPESVGHGWTSGSQWRLSARLDPERGALVQAAIAAVAGAEGLTVEDALVRVAEIALAATGESDSGSDSQGRQRGGLPALRGDERAAVVIHLDAAALPAAETDQIGSAEPIRPYARISGGPGLPDRVVKRLLCAGRIRTAVRDGTGGTVLDLGRSRRLVTDRQSPASPKPATTSASRNQPESG